MSSLIKTNVDRTRETIIWIGNAKKSCSPLCVELAGITLPDQNYAIRRTRNSKRNFDNLFVIEYVIAGVGYIESEGIKTEVKAGDLYIIHRRTVHSYYADRKQPYSKKWINVSGSFINAMADVFLGKEPFSVFSLGAQAEVIIDRIHRILQEPNTGQGHTENEIMRQLMELFFLVEQKKRSEDTGLSLFDRISDYIDHNVSSELSVSLICDKFFISSSTLYRIFKSNTGMSPKEYVQSKKIDAAKRMIAANNSPLNAIAASLGFYDSHHFFHAFKAATGMSPSEYRKTILQESD